MKVSYKKNSFFLISSMPLKTTPQPWPTSWITVSLRTASGRTRNTPATDSYLQWPLALMCLKARNSPSTTGLIWRFSLHLIFSPDLNISLQRAPQWYMDCWDLHSRIVNWQKTSIVDFIWINALWYSGRCVQKRINIEKQTICHYFPIHSLMPKRTVSAVW